MKERGLIMVNTGNGKGKTTASLGAAVRASGQGLNILILQFIKGFCQYGELNALAKLPNVEIKALGLGMIQKGKDQTPHKKKAMEAWEECKKAVSSEQYDLIIFDEINLVLHYGFIPLEEVLELLRNKPHRLHLILTGRSAPQEILDSADTVTEMREIKHHLNAGIRAVKGIEY